MGLGRIINANLVKAMFGPSHEHVKFAFVGNHINRYIKLKNIVSQCVHLT